MIAEINSDGQWFVYPIYKYLPEFSDLAMELWWQVPFIVIRLHPMLPFFLRCLKMGIFAEFLQKLTASSEEQTMDLLDTNRPRV